MTFVCLLATYLLPLGISAVSRLAVNNRLKLGLSRGGESQAHRQAVGQVEGDLGGDGRFLTQEALEEIRGKDQHLAGGAGYQFYVCGPKPMMRR